VRTDILQDPSLRVWLTNDPIDRYIKMGYGRFCEATHLLWDRQVFDDVAQQALYPLPATFLEMDRLEWDGKRIDPLSAADLMLWDPNFQTREGEVMNYVIGQAEGPLSLRKIRVPAVTSVNKCFLEFFRCGDALTGPSSAFMIPARWVEVVCWFAAARCYQMDGPGQSLALGKAWMDRFTAATNRALVGMIGESAANPIIMGEGSYKAGRRPAGPVWPDGYPKVNY